MATICAPSYAGKTRGGGRIVANRGPYSEWSCKRKVGGPDAFFRQIAPEVEETGLPPLPPLRDLREETGGKRREAVFIRPLGTDEPL